MPLDKLNECETLFVQLGREMYKVYMYVHRVYDMYSFLSIYTCCLLNPANCLIMCPCMSYKNSYMYHKLHETFLN